MANEIKLVSLHIYPVKSCAGIQLAEVEIGPRGPLWDRNWMIVDESDRFLTQRQLPRLSLIKTALDTRHLTLSAQGQGELRIPLQSNRLQEREVEVWADRCIAFDEGDSASQWLSSFIGQPVRLVRMDPNFERKVNAKYGIEGAQTGFADSLPFLLTSEESLADLNGRLEQPVPMNRFRPNLVIRGAPAYSEDTWKRVRLGAIELDFSRACTRCAITTVDQKTAEAGKEPLKTLATYRRADRGIVFGQNLIHLNTGWLRAGDSLMILQTK